MVRSPPRKIKLVVEFVEMFVRGSEKTGAHPGLFTIVILPCRSPNSCSVAPPTRFVCLIALVQEFVRNICWKFVMPVFVPSLFSDRTAKFVSPSTSILTLKAGETGPTDGILTL